VVGVVVYYVDKTKRRTPFIAADGHAETAIIQKTRVVLSTNLYAMYGRSMLITVSVDFGVCQ